MATITINVDDETETKFRESVKHELGDKKGALGTAVKEALGMWISHKNQEEIMHRQLQWLEKGFHMSAKKYNRDELHER